MGGDPKLKLWSLLLLIGSGCVFLAFFMPWWGVTQTYNSPPKRDPADLEQYKKDLEAYSEKQKKVSKVMLKNRAWYRNKISQSKQDAAGDEVKVNLKDLKDGGSFTVTMRLWGWNTGVGLTGFILSFFLMAVGIVPMFVKLLRRWIWTGYFAAAVIGLIMVILSLVWYFSSPGENVSGMLSQGVGLSPGPYLEILGSFAILAAGVLGGVFGLLHFLQSLKSGKAATVAVEPPAEELGEFE